MRTRPRRIIPFMPASPSKERLESRIYRKRLRPIKPQIDALLKAIDAEAIQRDWPADLRSEYRTVLKNLALQSPGTSSGLMPCARPIEYSEVESSARRSIG